jgi:hypothetical protein
MTTNILEQQIKISQKDLHWLYWGSEEEQIIAKLTNAENRFMKFISNLKKNNTNENILFTNILLEIKKEGSDIKNAIFKEITDEQLQRLEILDKKYGLIYNHDYELRQKQKRKDMLNTNKTNIIKQIIEEIIKEYSHKHLIRVIMFDDVNLLEQKYEFIYKCKAQIEKQGYSTYNDEIKELAKQYIIKYL